jgi:hypothetical protein
MNRISLLFCFSVGLLSSCACVESSKVALYSCQPDNTCTGGLTCCADQLCKASCESEPGVVNDGGQLSDGGSAVDGGSEADGGMVTDAGFSSDGGIECNASTCSKGCCTSTGQCLIFGDQNESLCGVGGAQCNACNSAPAAICTSSTQRKAFITPGTCAMGVCEYASATVTCVNGCDNGTCVNDKCQGCLQAPAAQCVGSSLRTYKRPGNCVNNSCMFDPVDTACPFGCEAGACKPDPCANVTCNTPPAAVCAGSALDQPESTGTCSAGKCDYRVNRIACANGCANGACIGCSVGQACSTNPSAPCKSGLTECPNGTNSTAVCVDNVNVAAGTQCTPGSTPARTCASNTAVRTFSSAGSCQSGVCQNNFTDMVCEQTVAPTCDGNTLNQYASSGSCQNGRCFFGVTQTLCQFGCSNGECLPGAQCRQTCVTGCNPSCPTQCAEEACF